MKPVDLHTHSTFSDGTCTPSQLVDIAREKGLAAFALTDHDNADGIEEAMAAARGTDVEVIPGIELSTKYGEKDVHIVGLFYNYSDPAFREAVKRFSDERDLRNRKMCDMMCAAGLPIPYEELVADNAGAAVTRANMAQFLLKKGAVSSVSEAFEKYIGDDCPFFVPRDKITPQTAVGFLLRFHAIPILAHPFQYKLGDEGLEQLVRELKAAGLAGIEAYYCTHTPEMTQRIVSLASRYDLLLSGGSDFHGANKPGLEMGNGYGHLCVPEDCLTRIRHRRFHVNEETKIFFCDFDGTLATDEKTISAKTRTALDHFIRRGRTAAVKGACGSTFCGSAPREAADGNVFVLSTGRAMCDAKNLAAHLELHYPNMYISAWNGAEIYDCDTGTTFFRESVPYEVVRGVMKMAQEDGLYCQAYDDEGIVIPEWGKETDYYTARVKLPVRVDPMVRTEPQRVLPAPPCKCLVIHLENPQDHALEAFAQRVAGRFGEVVRTVPSNPWYLEVDPIRATKGNSLRWLCRHLGIDPRNSIAAGDAPNDNPMLEAAGLGIGMCNGLPANPGMEDAADIITQTDNNHDGLAGLLDRL